MNQYEALEIRDTETGEGSGKWHFVCRNKRIGTFPVGFCREHGGHDSPEEARQCFKDYMISGAQELEVNEWSGCEICDEPTKGMMKVRGPVSGLHSLCEKHRKIEFLETLIKPPEMIWSSW